jgi:hypothetical protein
MGDHDPGTQVELYCCCTEQCSGYDQSKGNKRNAQNSAHTGNTSLIPLQKGSQCQHKHGSRKNCRTVSMRDLDQKPNASLSRRERSVAVRPMVSAAQARAGYPNDCPEYYLKVCERECHVRNAAEQYQ